MKKLFFTTLAILGLQIAVAQNLDVEIGINYELKCENDWVKTNFTPEVKFNQTEAKYFAEQIKKEIKSQIESGKTKDLKIVGSKGVELAIFDFTEKDFNYFGRKEEYVEVYDEDGIAIGLDTIITLPNLDELKTYFVYEVGYNVSENKWYSQLRNIELMNEVFDLTNGISIGFFPLLIKNAEVDVDTSYNYYYDGNNNINNQKLYNQCDYSYEIKVGLENNDVQAYVSKLPTLPIGLFSSKKFLTETVFLNERKEEVKSDIALSNKVIFELLDEDGIAIGLDQAIEPKYVEKMFPLISIKTNLKKLRVDAIKNVGFMSENYDDNSGDVIGIDKFYKKED